MKNKLLFTLSAACVVMLSSCGSKPEPMDKVIERSLSAAKDQYMMLAEVMKDKPDLLPRTIDTAGKHYSTFKLVDLGFCTRNSLVPL